MDPEPAFKRTVGKPVPVYPTMLARMTFEVVISGWLAVKLLDPEVPVEAATVVMIPAVEGKVTPVVIEVI
jgi:hypothetical protein